MKLLSFAEMAVGQRFHGRNHNCHNIYEKISAFECAMVDGDFGLKDKSLYRWSMTLERAVCFELIGQTEEIIP